MISLAIPNFNRSDFVIESFIQVIDNDIIDEIVIIDDCSSVDVFNKLSVLITDLNNSKVKLYRNDVNLKPFMNKYETVKKCSNDWIILLDSDNIIDDSYIEVVSKLDMEDDTIYNPEILYKLNKKEIGWIYKEYNNLVIDRNNAKHYIDSGNFETCLNTGNYCFNRKKYIHVIEHSHNDVKISVNDALYFSYLWLLSGNKIRVIPGLHYIHRIHDGSWYLNNYDGCTASTIDIKRKIREL